MKPILTGYLCGLTLVSTQLFTQSCGDPTFVDGSGQHTLPVVTPSEGNVEVATEPPAQPTPIAPNIQKSLGLTWFLTCESASLPPPAFPSDQDLIQGTGSKELSSNKFSDVPVTFRGQVCPVDQSRDIVFIVDVSGSMNQANRGNDPLTNGTCNRLEAVKQVIAATGGSNGGEFAIVTFNATNQFASTKFYTTLNGALEGNAASIICAANLGTNYKDPLVQAQNLFASGRPGASHEIYFISDGLPDIDGSGTGPDNNAINGKTEAKALRDSGAIVATVMLGNFADGDAFMRNYISSRVIQAGGQETAVHASVTNTNDLTRVLTQLSNNDIVSGIFQYRAIGSAIWQAIDLLNYRKGDEFQLPPLRVNPANTPNGMEFIFSYRDRRNMTHQSSGNFVWHTSP